MQLSRSEQKRRVKEIEKLVVELSKLSSQVLDSCPLSPEVITLLKEVHGLKGGAAKRQLKYVTKLLKDVNLDDVYSFIGDRKGAALIEKKRFHEIEYWRDALINEALDVKKYCQTEGIDWNEKWDSAVLPEIVSSLPGVDQKNLLRLAYLFVQTRNPKHSREIFRYLKSVMEQQIR